MTEAPNPWDLVLGQMEKLEGKIDRVGERVVPRDEFERYKTHQEKAHAERAAAVKEVATDLATHKEKLAERERTDAAREQDERARWRLFWAGAILSPVIAGVLAWLISGGMAR